MCSARPPDDAMITPASASPTSSPAKSPAPSPSESPRVSVGQVVGAASGISAFARSSRSASSTTIAGSRFGSSKNTPPAALKAMSIAK